MIRNNLAGVLLFGLLSLSILVAIVSSAKGAQLVSLEKKIKALEDQNRELESLVVAGNSLKQIAAEAGAAGLVENGALVYWNQDITVANVTVALP